MTTAHARGWSSAWRGGIALFDEASNRYLPQAIIKAELDVWTELLRTGRIEPERVDLYGETRVLEALLSIHQLSRRPLELRCSMMSADKKNPRSARARRGERHAS